MLPPGGKSRCQPRRPPPRRRPPTIFPSARSGSTGAKSRSSSPICRSSIRTTICGTGPAGAICSTNCWPTPTAATTSSPPCSCRRARCTAPTGPDEMRPVGETEFVNGVAAMSASGIYGKTRHCAGIVGHADLTLGSRVEPVLAAHIRAGGDRFRGIRHITAWDADDVRSAIPPTARRPACWPTRPSARASPSSAASASPSTPGSITRRSTSWPISRAPSRKRGSCSTTSAARSASAPMPASARSVPGVGGIDQGARRLSRTSTSSSAASACASAASASTSRPSRRPPRRWPPRGAPTSRPASRRSAPSRCMFESNFPVDKGSYSYPVFWNACKLLAKGASARREGRPVRRHGSAVLSARPAGLMS